LEKRKITENKCEEHCFFLDEDFKEILKELYNLYNLLNFISKFQ